MARKGSTDFMKFAVVEDSCKFHEYWLTLAIGRSYLKKKFSPILNSGISILQKLFFSRSTFGSKNLDLILYVICRTAS